MGEVYRARDTKLNRDVALKVLPEAFTLDPDRVARFGREAQVLAALNHPNIGAIYGVEESDGAQALVLELVEGPTLADRIAQRPLPLDEALPVARQIAEALEAAHEQGIIHRDLKPANIKLRLDGTVKVLDFGLAKALEATPARNINATTSPTTTSPAMMTGVGVILGTAAYMSPEQARGKPIDKRADIWAFGCVLYEMLTGRRAFEGEDVSMTLSKVLQREPDFEAFPANVPPRVRQAIRVCLRKPSRERVGDIHDVRLALEGAFDTEPERMIANRRAARSRMRLAWLAAGALAGLIAWRSFPPSDAPADRPVVRFGIPLPSPITDTLSLAVSPDGRRVAYSLDPQGVFLRTIDESDAHLVKGTEGGTDPFFSPGGESLAFFAGNTLRKIRLDGGTAVTLCEAPTPRGGAWFEGGSIVWGTAFGGLMQVSEDGGQPQRLTTPDAAKGEVSHRYPVGLQGGRVVLFAAGPSINANSWNSSHIVALTVATGEQRILVSRGSSPQVANGYLTYLAGNTLFSQRFDVDRLTLQGLPIAAQSAVRRAPSGAGRFALAANGTLVFAHGESTPIQLVWADRHGLTTPLALAPGYYVRPKVSPDGFRIAVTVSNPDSDIWLYDVAGGSFKKFTTDGRSLWPLWTPDGKGIAFSNILHGQASLQLKQVAGSETSETLVENGERAEAWTPGGRALVYGVTPIRQILRGVKKSSAVPQSRDGDRDPALSPDGRWLATSSAESGRVEIHLLPFDHDGERRPVSTAGGSNPVWSRDGHELFFVRNREIWSAAVKDGVPAKPQKLFEGPFELGAGLTGGDYDVAPDGRFLLATLSGSPPAVLQIDVVLNWTKELVERDRAR
jgi:eukaryotic-like serine/threonine-protein kinase